jgi:uncharacterized protein (DUF488 family)
VVAAIFTIGHSTHTPEEFAGILRAHGIERLVDIRTVPRSRRNPQFNREGLPEELARYGITYEHLPALGGLRRSRPDSPNTGWRNAGFRGYADYMSTAEFRGGIDRLLEAAREQRCAILCAEAVPWRCHRSLVADALVVRGLTVEHILSATRSHGHRITPFARITGSGLTYPNEEARADPVAAASGVCYKST